MSQQLSTEYLGIPLSGPVIASAGPLTRDVDSMLALQEAGAAAIVLPSLFQEEVEAEQGAALELMDLGEGFAEFDSAPLPAETLDGVGPAKHLRRLAQARAALEIPVIASLNATGVGEWSRYARMMAEAGADAIELNLYAVPTDPNRTAAQVEEGLLAAIAEVRSVIEIPLAVKLSQHLSALSNFAARAQQAGADGLVLFNRFYGADLDCEELTVHPRLTLSSPDEITLPLRWIGILRSQRPGLGLAATSGVHSWAEVAKVLLAGADVACTTSATLLHGPGVITEMLAGLREWMAAKDYDSVDQLRGSMSAASVADPGAFARAQYISVITS